jgi:hypothetical protein
MRLEPIEEKESMIIIETIDRPSEKFVEGLRQVLRYEFVTRAINGVGRISDR